MNGPIASGDLSSPPLGGLDPLLRGAITGWAPAGTRVTLLIDDAAVEEVIAGEARLQASDDPAERCGFQFTLPDQLFNGLDHRVRVTVDTRDLPGSPLTARPERSIEGKIERLADTVLIGRLRTGGKDPLPIAAMIGDETVALAIARPVDDEPGTLRFALLLPASAFDGRNPLVQVGVVGSAALLDGSPWRLPTRRGPRATLREVKPAVTLAIKVGAMTSAIAEEWGDYHFAESLGAALQKRGWQVRIDCRRDWARGNADATLVLRGRHRYRPLPGPINLMWMISHPDLIHDNEFSGFDHIFVASEFYAPVLRSETDVPVTVMHQATDPLKFRPPDRRLALSSPLLFVGNSRGQFRTMIRWILEQRLAPVVVGRGWEGLVPDEFIRRDFVANAELHRWYGSCAILLNDHWTTMSHNGFLSNRLFDGSASGAFIISDEVAALGRVFGDAIVTAATSDDLNAEIARYLADPAERSRRAEKARAIVLSAHTFDHRADQIITVFEQLNRSRAHRLTAPR